MSPALAAAVSEVRSNERRPARYSAGAVRVAFAIDRLALVEQALASVANELEAGGGVPVFGEVARLRELAAGAREVLHRLGETR